MSVLIITKPVNLHLTETETQESKYNFNEPLKAQFIFFYYYVVLLMFTKHEG